MRHYDVLIVGAGPAVKKCAARLAELGRTVALVALPENPETLQQRLLQALSCPDSPSNQTCEGGGNAAAFHSKIDFYSSACRFESPRVIRVNDHVLSADRFVIAPGAEFAVPAIEGLDQVPFETPLSLLSLRENPLSAAVIGGGPIGVATANRLCLQGCRVTLISRRPRVLEKEDPAVSGKFEEILRRAGVSLHLGAHIIGVRNISGAVSLALESAEGRTELSTQTIVIATGLRPHTKELNLKAAEVVTDQNGWIVVNEEMRTSSPRIWAWGAATGAAESFSLESFQAEMVVHNMTAPFFSKRKLEPDNLILFTVPTSPPFSRVGWNETEARAKYKDVVVSFTEGTTGNRYIKLIGRKRGNELLGAHIIAPESGSIGLFFELAMRAGVSVTDLAESRFFPPVGTTKFVYESISEWMDAAS